MPPTENDVRNDGGSAGSLPTPRIELPDGSSIPWIGFGTATLTGADATDMVTSALASGYRMVDTATKYGNETEVGEGIAQSTVAREEITVITKVRGSDHGHDSTLRACEASLERLGLEYVDLYLIHWPLPMIDKYVETWKAMIELRGQGLVRSIGVSNFTLDNIDRLEAETGVMPPINQIEMHPRVPQTALRDGMRQRSVKTMSFSPLDRGSSLISAPEIIGIAEAHGVTTGQVILRWHIQLEAVPIPRSRSVQHVAQNLDIFSFELSGAEMEMISGSFPSESPHFDPETHEEL